MGTCVVLWHHSSWLVMWQMHVQSSLLIYRFLFSLQILELWYMNLLVIARFPISQSHTFSLSISVPVFHLVFNPFLPPSLSVHLSRWPVFSPFLFPSICLSVFLHIPFSLLGSVALSVFLSCGCLLNSKFILLSFSCLFFLYPFLCVVLFFFNGFILEELISFKFWLVRVTVFPSLISVLGPFPF